MKYLLIVGLLFKKFRNHAKVVITTGDRLIDDFDITEDKTATTEMLRNIKETSYTKADKRGFTKHHLIQTSDSKKKWEYKAPRYYKVYEIDETNLGTSINFKVSNMDSDFTNGFMKNSALIMFPIIALIPKNLTENDCDRLMNAIFWLRDAPYHHTKTGKRQINELYNRVAWPVVHGYYVQRDNEIYEKSNFFEKDTWLGGDFTFEIHLKHKHNIKYLCTTSKTHGFFNVLFPESHIIGSCKQLLNIYNENKRSDIT